jgi:DNA-binding transcriptional regulator LsrR (DeoR family)
VSADDPRRLILRACQLYYRDDLSNVEIGKRLGLSRFQVARLLKRGRDEGYVVIKILEPSGWHSELERALEERYGLDVAVVVDDDAHSLVELRRRVADAAGRLLVDLAADDQMLGISLGQTMQDLVEQLPDRIVRTTSVVQMIGSTPHGDSRNEAPVLAADLAMRFGTRPFLMYAPALVGAADVRGSLLGDASIHATFERFRELDVAFVGIGSITEADSSRLVYGGALEGNDVVRLRERGAVGDVLAFLFDTQGDVVESGLEDRILAIGLDDFRRIPRRIGVAAGVEKAAAIAGALRGGFVNTLVTDSTVAKRLCSEEGRPR